jgi:NAD(P)-dependent dehydrogenase (short-subunit alcohol dehydrogenase family)
MTADFDLTSFPQDGVAVVVGASGGVGGALMRRLQASRRFSRVYDLGRSGAAVPLDLTDESSIAAAAATVNRSGFVRLIVNAAGFLHDDRRRPEKSWRELDGDHMARAFAVNAIGPGLLMKHFMPLLAPTGKAVFAVLSARVGSIGDNKLGGWYSYRASKAALNQLVRTASVELRRSNRDAVCVALHPGTVDTGLSRPFMKAGLDVQTPDVAALRLLEVIDRLAPEHSGGFFDYRGDEIEW